MYCHQQLSTVRSPSWEPPEKSNLQLNCHLLHLLGRLLLPHPGHVPLLPPPVHVHLLQVSLHGFLDLSLGLFAFGLGVRVISENYMI